MATMSATVAKQIYGRTGEGKQVDIYTLANSAGMSVQIITYGGIIVTLNVPARNGQLADVALGLDNLEAYVKGHPYFGAIIGRCGNRIAKGRFSLDGREYPLATNDGPNALHGGIKGFDKVLWDAEVFQSANQAGVKMTYLSKDMEEGYPGNLSASVTYSLNDQNELKIEYSATTDKPTVVGMTNHTYFNLAGAGNGDILGHEIQIEADAFTPVGGDLIPTGEIVSLKGTPLDFAAAHRIGERINSDHQQMIRGKGYDHNYVLRGGAGSAGGSSAGGMALAASAYEPASGRLMECYTTEPGMQFYTGNFLPARMQGKAGQTYVHRGGFCLETQHFPDWPNQPEFPSAVLRPGQTYHSQTMYRFSSR